MRYLSGHSDLVQAVAFSPDGRLLASGGSDGTLRVWDVLSGEQLHAFASLGGGGDRFGAVAFSPDGKRVAGGTHGGDVWLWDATPSAGGDAEDIASWHQHGRIVSLAFTPAGSDLVCGSYSGGVVHSLVDPPGAPVSFTAPGGLVYSLRLAPDGRSFATAGTGSHIHIRDLPSASITQSLPHGDHKGCWCLAYAPSGRWLGAALSGGVQTWDLRRGEAVSVLKEHDNVATGVVFSPDGRHLLTCGWDETARLYEFDDATGRIGRRVATYDWKLGLLYDVAISPDGMLAAAAGGKEPYLVIWDLE